MTPAERSALRERVAARLLDPVVIAAFDRANEAGEIAAQAIAKARVSSEIELLMKDDDDIDD